MSDPLLESERPLDDPPADLDELLAPVLAPSHSTDPLPLVLQAVQDKYGYVPQRHLRHAAFRLNIPHYKAHRLARLSPSLHLKPPGRCELRVCLGPVCRDQGSSLLLRAVERELGVSAEHTTPTGAVTLHTIYCSGACQNAPVMVVSGRRIGPVTPARATSLVRRVLSGDVDF